jgi:hypothetical protein
MKGFMRFSASLHSQAGSGRGFASLGCVLRRSGKFSPAFWLGAMSDVTAKVKRKNRGSEGKRLRRNMKGKTTLKEAI